MTGGVFAERLLLLGLGNILMGDDGVGVHTVEELKEHDLPGAVDIIDGGTGGLDLVDLLGQYDTVIVVDAIRGEGGALEGVRLLSPRDLCATEERGAYSMHDMGLDGVLELMGKLGMSIPEISIIGIPARETEPGIGLSRECMQALPEAVELVKEVVARYRCAIKDEGARDE